MQLACADGDEADILGYDGVSSLCVPAVYDRNRSLMRRAADGNQFESFKRVNNLDALERMFGEPCKIDFTSNLHEWPGLPRVVVYSFILLNKIGFLCSVLGCRRCNRRKLPMGGLNYDRYGWAAADVKEGPASPLAAKLLNGHQRNFPFCLDLENINITPLRLRTGSAGEDKGQAVE